MSNICAGRGSSAHSLTAFGPLFGAPAQRPNTGLVLAPVAALHTALRGWSETTSGLGIMGQGLLARRGEAIAFVNCRKRGHT